MKFADRIHRLGTEGAFETLARARALEALGKEIIHLEIGEPDFDTPVNISEAAIKALRDGHTHYGPSAGLPIARKAVADYFAETRGITVGPENAVIMPGVKPVIFNAMMAIVEAGDEVIVPDPGYPIYQSLTNYLGATPVSLHLREKDGFRFLVDELRALVTPKTRVILLNSPANPTGGVLTKADMEAIYELAEKHDLWIITDEIYSKFVYEGEFVSVTSIPGAFKRTVVIDGMSKAWAMTGWRLGFGVMPQQLAEYMAKLAINNFSCTSSFLQYGLIEGLRGPQDEVKRIVAEFKKRREVIVDGLNRIDGITCLKGHGAFYAFANITGTGLDSHQVAELLMDKAGVACLAGTAFGKFGEGYIRFSYANSIENLGKALSRIESTLRDHRHTGVPAR
jgi:aspartate aminotransferase